MLGRISVLSVVATLAARSPALADAKADAAKLFEQARSLVERGKQDQACDLFRQSYDLDPLPGTALNLGDCAEKRGEPARAWRLFEGAAKDFEQANKLPQAKFARDRAEAVGKRLAIVIVKLAEPDVDGLGVTIGDREVPAGDIDDEIVDRLEPGAIVVRVTAPGREPFSKTADGLVGKHTIVEVPALTVAAKAAPGGPVDKPAPSGGRKRGRVRLAFGVGGAGLLALAGAGIVGYNAKTTYESAFIPTGSCYDDNGSIVCETDEDATKIRDAGTYADVATGLAIGGGVLVAVGVILYVTAPRETAASPARVQILPTVTPTSGGLAISGTF